MCACLFFIVSLNAAIQSEAPNPRTSQMLLKFELSERECRGSRYAITAMRAGVITVPLCEVRTRTGVMFQCKVEFGFERKVMIPSASTVRTNSSCASLSVAKVSLHTVDVPWSSTTSKVHSSSASNRLTLTTFTKSISQLRVLTRQLVAGVAGEGPSPTLYQQ